MESNSTNVDATLAVVEMASYLLLGTVGAVTNGFMVFLFVRYKALRQQVRT